MSENKRKGLDLSRFQGGIDQAKALAERKAEEAKKRAESSGNGPLFMKQIYMYAPPNNGTITLVPFQGSEDGEFFLELPGTLMLKIYHDLGGGKGEFKWFRILKKEFYDELDEKGNFVNLPTECNSLYNSVVAKWWEAKKCKILEKPYPEKSSIDSKSFGLTFGYVITHINSKGEEVLDKNVFNGKTTYKNHHGPALVITTFKNYSLVLDAGIKSSETAGGLGDRSTWLADVFSAETKGRDGVMIIKQATKPLNENGKKQPGYDYNITFDFNSTRKKIVPADFEITEEMSKLFVNIKKTFLGFMWDKENNRPFNMERFTRMESFLNLSLNKYQASKNGVKDADVNAKTQDAPNDPTPPEELVGEDGRIDPLN